jgi:hypothetical protein
MSHPGQHLLKELDPSSTKTVDEVLAVLEKIMTDYREASTENGSPKDLGVTNLKAMDGYKSFHQESTYSPGS